MNTNEKIAKWLGFKNIRNIKFPDIGLCIVDGIVPIKLDFLHDRNQQKWIREKLKELGYSIETETDSNGTKVIIWNPGDSWEIPNDIYDEDEDTAFIEAVLELITKEEIKC